jgi:hypothetical protein
MKRVKVAIENWRIGFLLPLGAPVLSLNLGCLRTPAAT